jgi:leader peptidase (prepilin peptidase)/N-methyltransferase
MPALPSSLRAPIFDTLAFLGVYGALAVPLLWRVDAGTGPIPASIVLGATLAALSAIDLRQYRLPDWLTLPLTALGPCVAWWSGTIPVWWSIVSAALGFGMLAGIAHVYRAVRGRAGLGLGDAKLLGASGAWLGAEGLPTVLLWATAAALACVLVARWRGSQLSGSTRLPFGPFLAFATWLVWLYGPI